MAKSINELRKICQETKTATAGALSISKEQESWLARNFFRRISIYFTKFFLIIGISANQASLMGLFIGVIAAGFFTFAKPLYWIIGALLFLLHLLFDFIDGEIARYNKSESPTGGFYDRFSTSIAGRCLLICMAFGIYNTFHRIDALIIGFIALLFLDMSTISVFMPYSLLYGKAPSSQAQDKQTTGLKKEAPLVKIMWTILNYAEQVLIFVILIVAIVDCFVSPFAIGSYSFNARYIYFIICAIGALITGIMRTYFVVHKVLKLPRF